MAAIILGGWAGGNWTPMLVPVIAVLVLILAVDYLARFIKRKLRHNKHAAEGTSGDQDSQNN
jgi:ABC-type dipeptide/oligopeptide/nickel transport system permease subunit